MTDLSARLARGAAAGFVATGPMALFMAALHRLLPEHEQHPLPPRQITEDAADKAGVGRHRFGESELRGLTGVAHFGYGAGAGAVYAALAPHLPLPPVASGVAYGLAVWAGSYLGLIPAGGFRPAAHRETPRRNALMIAAHVVYGAALGAANALMEREFRDAGADPAAGLRGPDRTPLNEALTSAQL
jgi:hypothetical protein